VQAAISDVISRLKAIGVPWGIMGLVPEVAKGYIAQGASFVAVGVDLVLLADAVKTLHGTFSD
jgi:4-hydroxy-2-oxoheptanedioate aldolase